MIIFGLGNPGLKYRWTRHNAGFVFLDTLAREYQKRFRRFIEYQYTAITIAGKRIKLIKPLLFMNRSGIVVSHILNKRPDVFMVVLDDINLPLGRLRFRARGSDGGHLGLGSIIETQNTEEFPRLRIGIANQESIERRIDSAEFVLEQFNNNEKRILKAVIEKGIQGIEIFVSDGFERAQNFVNSVNLQIEQTHA